MTNAEYVKEQGVIADKGQRMKWEGGTESKVARVKKCSA